MRFRVACLSESDYTSLLPILQAAKGLEWNDVCLVNFFTSMSQGTGAAKGLRHMFDVEVGAMWWCDEALILDNI